MTIICDYFNVALQKKREKITLSFIVVVDYRLPSSRPPLGNGQLPIATEMRPSRLVCLSIAMAGPTALSAAITQTVIGRGDLWIRLSSIFKRTAAKREEKPNWWLNFDWCVLSGRELSVGFGIGAGQLRRHTRFTFAVDVIFLFSLRVVIPRWRLSSLIYLLSLIVFLLTTFFWRNSISPSETDKGVDDCTAVLCCCCCCCWNSIQIEWQIERERESSVLHASQGCCFLDRGVMDVSSIDKLIASPSSWKLFHDRPLILEYYKERERERDTRPVCVWILFIDIVLYISTTGVCIRAHTSHHDRKGLSSVIII